MDNETTKTEQPETTLTPEAQNVKDKVQTDSYGKFSTKEALIEAYNSLEKEFTRRSQRIKELEAQTKQQPTEDDKWQKKVDALNEKYPVAKKLTKEIGDFIADNKQLINDENCLETALLSVLAKGYNADTSAVDKGATAEASHTEQSADAKALSTKEQALLYVKSDAVALPKVLPHGGEIPAQSPMKPATVREASRLARQIIKNI